MLHDWVEKICSGFWAWYHRKTKNQIQRKKCNEGKKVRRIYLKRRRQPMRCR